MVNWKTTAAGVAAILTSLAHLVAQLSGGSVDFNTIGVDITGVMAGVGLIMAKDHNVTGGTVKQPDH